MFFQEETLIPFQTSQLPAGPWIVFAPHADDETFGMGGTILKARQQKIETHLVVLTDGSKGGEGADLVEVRKNEVHQAASLLGVKSLFTWSVSDRCLEVNDEIVFKASSLIRDLSPATVFFQGCSKFTRITEPPHYWYGKHFKRSVPVLSVWCQYHMRLVCRIR